MSRSALSPKYRASGKRRGGCSAKIYDPVGPSLKPVCQDGYRNANLTWMQDDPYRMGASVFRSAPKADRRQGGTEGNSCTGVKRGALLFLFCFCLALQLAKAMCQTDLPFPLHFLCPTFQRFFFPLLFWKHASTEEVRYVWYARVFLSDTTAC